MREAMSNDMPALGRLHRGAWTIGHGSACRWHGALFGAVRMVRNGRGAFLCPKCDFPDDIAETYREVMTSE
jgi:hypothetical protein